MYELEINELLDSSKRVNIAITNKQWFKESELYKNIIEETKWVEELNPELNINQRIILIRDNITDFKICPICSNKFKFKIPILKTTTYCSKRCSHVSSLAKRLESQKINNLRKIDSQEIRTLEETKDFIKLQFNKTNGVYEQQAVKHGFYKSIIHYNNIEDISFIAKMYNVLNDIKELPKCKNCNEEITSFINKNDGYRIFCSVSCQVSSNTEKRIQTYFNTTGYLSPHHNPEVIEQKIKNSIIKWGYEVPQLNPTVLSKSKSTRFERYGDEKYVNKEQKEETNLQKYGVKSVLSLQDKKEEAMLVKYGVRYYAHHKDFKNKYEETCLAKYGVRNYTQLGITNGYKWYEYILPSGNIAKYQGYEGRYIPVLLRAFGEENICFNKSDIPSIKYIGLDNKDHYYFPDFYIPSKNLIIEIKSEYTLNCSYEINMLKFQAVKDAGYNFKLKIYKIKKN